MCGVCGMAGGSERERISFVTASTETFSYRVPDAVGIKVPDGAVLGHTKAPNPRSFGSRGPADVMPERNALVLLQRRGLQLP